jgi:hypothetical protein
MRVRWDAAENWDKSQDDKKKRIHHLIIIHQQ